MQVVILAAGRGKRMGDLTENLPKPLIKIGNKNLLEYKLDILPPEIDEIIFIVGYLESKIKDYFGDSYKGKNIKYVYQKDLLGTGHSLWQAKDILNDRFVVMMGDDIYSRDDLDKCILNEQSILIKKIPFLSSGGKVLFSGDKKLLNIIEGEHNEKNAFINTGLYVLKKDFFNYDLVKISNRDEYGLPQTIVSMLEDFDIDIVQSEGEWFQMTNEEDVKKFSQLLEENSLNEKLIEL